MNLNPFSFPSKFKLPYTNTNRQIGRKSEQAQQGTSNS